MTEKKWTVPLVTESEWRARGVLRSEFAGTAGCAGKEREQGPALQLASQPGEDPTQAGHENEHLVQICLMLLLL